MHGFYPPLLVIDLAPLHASPIFPELRDQYLPQVVYLVVLRSQERPSREKEQSARTLLSPIVGTGVSSTSDGGETDLGVRLLKRLPHDWRPDAEVYNACEGFNLRGYHRGAFDDESRRQFSLSSTPTESSLLRVIQHLLAHLLHALPISVTDVTSAVDYDGGDLVVQIARPLLCEARDALLESPPTTAVEVPEDTPRSWKV